MKALLFAALLALAPPQSPQNPANIEGRVLPCRGARGHHPTDHA